MMAVAAVTTLTSAFQLLNGPNAAEPTTAAVRMETTGTRSFRVVASAVGISGLFAERVGRSRAVVAR